MTAEAKTQTGYPEHDSGTIKHFKGNFYTLRLFKAKKQVLWKSILKAEMLQLLLTDKSISIIK
jgi:hypothetical protein